MTETMPTPPVRFRVLRPDEPLTPGTGDDLDLYPNPVEAWREAARAVLVDGGPDAVETALGMLSLNSTRERHRGWRVVRWASTLTTTYASGARLAQSWEESVGLSRQTGGYDGTFGVVTAALIRDLLLDGADSVDVTVVANVFDPGDRLMGRRAMIGIVHDVDDDGTITFVDGCTSNDLGNIPTQVIAVLEGLR